MIRPPYRPRAFSITHVNLTHRNWTAIGVPDRDCLPIVVPMGLVTPFWDGWSLDGWIVARDGRRLIPSKMRDVDQRLELEGGIAVVTRSACDGMELLSRASVEERDGSAECVLSLRARSASDAFLVVALRPYNPEGVSFVEEVHVDRDGSGLRVGRRQAVLFDPAPERYAFSDYHAGDVHARLFDHDMRDGVRCKVGMATAAALYPIGGGGEREAVVRVPLEEAERFRESVEKSLAGAALRTGRPGMPASPYRRLDSGAVGSLSAGYPLQIFVPRDLRLLDTAEFLLSRCMVNGGFYQDIIHSGVNPYLTLHIAQVLLRAGDGRYEGLVRTVARLASPTGQWPEAVHPRTGGGCMGDGHHAWASAEWVLMIRNMFVREEKERLVLASGILPEWMEAAGPISLGPAPTSFGEVRVEIARSGRRAEVRWTGSWREAPSRVEVRLPGFTAVDAPAGQGSALLEPVAGP